MKKVLLLLICFILKTPGSFAFEGINPVINSFDQETISENNCVDLLNKEIQLITNFSSSQFQIAKNTTKEHLREIINASFLSRLKLSENLKALHQNRDFLSKECVSAFLKLNNTQREFEDRMIYFLNPNLKNANHKIALHGDHPLMLSNPKFGTFKYKESFKSGDIIISRGNTFISAAIARGNGSNNHFSHLSLVYIHEVTGKIFTIESHIETGVIIRPIEYHVAQKNSREAIYRYADAEVAHSAAKYMYALASRYKEPNNIPYDFARQLDEHSTIDCTEIVRLAYKAATNNKLLFPKYISKFPDNLKKFFNYIGVPTSSGFVPGDIEVDPRLELVAEWRDIKLVEDAKYKNEIITTMYKWIGEKQYSFKEDLTTFIKKNIGWHLRHWPFYLLKDKFPLTMSKEFISVGLTMELVAETLFEELNFKVESMNLDTIYFLQDKEISKILEEIRKKDLRNYQEKIPGNYANKLRVWPFHAYFR